MININVSGITGADLTKRVDVFVNGMLQLSGSHAQVTAGEADYRLSGAAASSDVRFAYALRKDDQIAVIIR